MVFGTGKITMKRCSNVERKELLKHRSLICPQVSSAYLFEKKKSANRRTELSNKFKRK